MFIDDVSAADALASLLDDQSFRLRALAIRVGECVASARLDGADRAEWSGPSRDARDYLAGRLGASLATALSSLERATLESARGASTLTGRG